MTDEEVKQAGNIDMTKVSDMGRAILSNYIFMEEILGELRKDE